MTLQQCLGQAARYRVGSTAYALASSRCYAQYRDTRTPADRNKVTFFTEDTWKKTSHDLLKYLLESGKCTAYCARVAEEAFMSTGWERRSKVSDVADTVYNITVSKTLCSDTTAKLVRGWVNSSLNLRLKAYAKDSALTPDPVTSQVGTGVIGTTIETVTEVILPPSETQKDSKIENLEVSTKGDEVTVTFDIVNHGRATEEIRGELWLKGKVVDKEPDTYWKNIRPGRSVTMSLTSHWHSGDIAKALTGTVKLREQRLGLLDEKQFGLGAAGIWAWIMTLGLKTILIIGIGIMALYAIMMVGKSPQAKAVKKVVK